MTSEEWLLKVHDSKLFEKLPEDKRDRVEKILIKKVDETLDGMQPTVEEEVHETLDSMQPTVEVKKENTEKKARDSYVENLEEALHRIKSDPEYRRMREEDPKNWNNLQRML